MAQHMTDHHASVVVNAPVHQVYSLFSHFNDFPKFMSFVKEVTYHDDQRSHWVAEVAGEHSWDAVNENWIPDRQICWRSVNGLNNRGCVGFQAVGQDQTLVNVDISYDPPAGILGDIGERLGAGQRFDEALQNDLNNFARMVDMAPVNAQDPTWSQYLFHPSSAAAKGQTTARQNATMGGEFSTPESAGSAQSKSSTPADTTSSGIASSNVNSSDYTPTDAAPTYQNRSDYTTTNATPTYQAGSTPDVTPQTDPLQARPFTTGTEGSSYTANDEGRELNRPILDRDIINEPVDAAPLDERERLARKHPEYSGPSDTYTGEESQIPPEQIPPRYTEGDQPRR
jgi:uncharacterized membrane protein